MSQAHCNIKQDSKTLGVIDGDILRIIKTSQNHFVKKYHGYGVSESTLDQAEKAGATLLELQGYDGETFKFPIRDFRAAAIPDDLGSGRQLFCAVRWLRYYTEQMIKATQPQQISMFG